MDYKNVEYVLSAKRLKACQTCWALFFGWFNFYLLYRQSSKNVKPDALFCLFEDPGREAETILYRNVVVGSLS